MIDMRWLGVDRQARLLAEADARRLARAASRRGRQPARPSRARPGRASELRAHLGEALIVAGRRLAPDRPERLPDC